MLIYVSRHWLPLVCSLSKTKTSKNPK